MTRPTFRFAPSPNGELHLGHAYSALLNAEMAQKGGRQAAAAHRGHRHGALHAGIRGRHLPRPRMARHRMGRAGAPPVRAFCRLRQAARPPDRRRTRLSRLHEPGRNARPYRRGGRQGQDMAARSRRRAALSRPGQGARPARAQAADDGRRAFRLAARHCQCDGTARRIADMDGILRPGHGLGEKDRGEAGRYGATWCWRAATRRRATTFPSSPTTRCRASPMSCAAWTSLPPPASTGCCRSYWACRSRPISITG